ncbi:peroxin 11C [Sarocladium implicatum]|nr:peroxin 11C [Sarocladium implicatum]
MSDEKKTLDLPSVPSRSHAFLSHLHRVVQSRGGNDITLLWLTYTSHLSADLLSLLANPVAHLPAPLLTSKAARPLLLLSRLLLKPGTLPAAVTLQLAARLKAFAVTLSEVRIFARLWGLLGIYFGAKAAIDKRKAQIAADPAAANSPEARFDSYVNIAQLVTLVAYQALENVAYLSARKVIPLSPYLTGRLGKWSVRSWMVYIGLELGKLLVDRARHVPKRAYDAESVKEEKEWQKNWSRDFLRTLAWAPLTVNWSLEQPVLPSLAVSAFAFYPAMGMMKDLWQSKAEA